MANAPKWTDEQLSAIEARGENLLLSAAAGSGKTTVLVERVLRLVLEDGADVDRMLVVTFTRAAASDMRAKLSKKLGERAAAGDARCREQTLRLERASITTLHAFCADFLRTHFEAAGVDPAFRVLDDAIARQLLDEALDEALEAAYEAGGEELLRLDYGRGPKDVRALTEALVKVLEERPEPEKWLAEACGCGPERLALWAGELTRGAKRDVAKARTSLLQARALPGCPPHYAAAIEKDLAMLDELAAIDEYDPLARAMAEVRFARAAGGRKSEPVDEGALEAVKRLRESAKDALKKAALMDHPAAQAFADMRALEPELRTLGALAMDASRRFEEKKAEQSGLTYADLERRALDALRNDDVAASVRERFDYVFVDEYQDTSDIQEAIVARVCRADNRFMVGDVKQSIYRFRMAEPKLFLDKYERFRRGEGGRLIPLTRNFRSRPTVLSFVNLVFERAMTGGDSEIVYDELARLNPGNPDAEPGAPVEIHILDRAAGDGADEAVAELKGAEREGLFIARQIRRMMAEDPTLRYRDFAVLTRAKSSAFTPMLPMLLGAGIPAYADGAAGYFAAPEIVLTLSMLRLVANRRSDVELIGVLRSPAAGLSAEELARIRSEHRDMSFLDAALKTAYGDDPDGDLPADGLAARLRAFFEMLDSWRLRAGAVGLGELVRAVLDESGFYVYAGALPGGAQRQANLDRLAADADAFDAAISGSVTRFLKHTERLRARGDGDAAHLLGENDDVVRLMTVHKSKGLEFRVVFGALLGKSYAAGREGLLSAHRDLGIGIAYYDPGLRAKRKTLAQSAITERQSREDAAEEMRILYVLLTRAQERLVLVGSVRDYARAENRWDALMDAPGMAGSYLDLLMSARAAAQRDGRPLFSAVTVHSASELTMDGPGARDPRARFDEIMESPERFADPALDDELSWRYPDELSARKPLKLTVSGLLRELEGPEQLPELAERPAFLADESASRMTGAERGTAYHRAMQLMELAALRGLEGRALADCIREMLDGFAAQKRMTQAQRDAVKPSMLARFLSGEAGQRLLRAGEVRREWPFNVMLRADEALSAQEAGRFGGEELLVQGTVDCCFIEDGQWVLMDYKTDRGDAQTLRERYRPQLSVYALALERITGIPVKEKLLCLLGQAQTVEV